METTDPTGVEQHLRHRYRQYEWRQITFGANGAYTYHLTGPADLYLKHAPQPLHPDPGFDVGAEGDRLRWLATSGIPVAEVVECDVADGHTYLVTTTVPGRDGSDDWPAAQRMAVMDALADFARELHSVPVAGCPFDRSLRVTLPNASVATGLGLVDEDNFEEDHGGWSAERLLTELTAMARDHMSEDLVLCHGDYCLPNVVIDPDTLRVTGIVDVGRFGLADRYQDLALMSRSVGGRRNPQYGAEHARRFLDRYGPGVVDTGKIAFYRLLDEFC